MNKDSSDRKITVVALCTALNEVGGVNKHLLNLYTSVDRTKYNFLIVYCSSKNDIVEKFFLEGGVKKADLFYFPTHKRMLFIPLVIKLRRLFMSAQVDIIHTFFLHSDIIGFFSAILSGKRVLISSVEGKFVLDEINGVNKLKQVLYRMANLIIRPHFYRTIVVSSALKEEVLRCYNGGTNKIVVVNVGIAIPSDEDIAVNSLSRQNRERKEKIVVTAARFSNDKRLDILLGAIPYIVKEIPQSRFIIAGAGNEAQALKQLAFDLGIQSIVSFPGWVKDIEKFMVEADVFVMTSVREGCPFALLEALSFAKPVVAFDVPGVKEIIVNEENGVLVDPFDSLKFASAVIKVCQNAEYAMRLGKNGRATVQKKFSVRVEADKIELLYSAAIDSRYYS